jgi:hypothetical protein
MDAIWRRGAAIALAAGVVLAVAARTPAQPGDGEKVHYSRTASFYIPFTPEQDAYRIRQVLLHVSEDFGKTYQYVGPAAPTEGKFKFTARREGSFWFVVQTQDVNGQLNPPNNQLSQAPVGLKVVVDTRKPQVELKPVQSKDGAPAEVDWAASDENLDVATLRLEYRPAGGREWFPLPIIQTAQGRHSWDPKINGRVEVRLQVRDKAGNEGEATVTLVPAGVNPSAGGAGPAPGGVADRGHDNLFYVNNKRFNLDYELDPATVGKSQVKHVEIWYTNDLGRSWKIYKEAPPQAPYPVEVAGEGRYGFAVVAVSGVGRAGPRPSSGDTPEVWVEVDTTAPKVRLLSVDPGQGVDQGRLTIAWTASDKNLAPQPISILYAEAPEGPWKPIAESLPNDGKFVWTVPESHPFQFYVRVAAIDQAKNVGQESTLKPVAVDTKIPKARIKGVMPTEGGGRLGVSPAAPEPAAPTPPGGVIPPGGQP